MESPPIQRPIPRRPFDLPSDFNAPPEAPKRTKSALNLTASTLFGIYSSTNDDSLTSTPLQLSRAPSSTNLLRQGTPLPSMTPLRQRQESVSKPRGPPPTTAKVLPYILLRVALLFAFGVAYGVIVAHFHERSILNPVVAAGIGFDVGGGRGRGYLLLWGLAGVGLGNLLPWLDGRDGEMGVRADEEGGKRGLGMGVVRSVGAFVGIAYAIRKLPWQSTLQVSLALALVNPFLWFVVDRTRSGFWFAMLVGCAGTVFLMHSPQVIAIPEIRHEPTMVMGVSSDTIAMVTWIASVLFCSCVCFGNIGRKLAGTR